ncbi:hypothetical protein AAVH_01256 [Aphelenchoides avenae]|nr:hypothetical protein AAVH_01256 [Aphelenchus avenae]
MADRAKNDVSLTLDRDALKLLFRNALAQKAVRTSAGLLIIKLAAVNKTCLDTIVRLTNQLGNALLTTDRMVLKRERWTMKCLFNSNQEHPIVITRSQFVWMVKWGMLRLQALTIALKNMSGWFSVIELFQMPSLRVLMCTGPFRSSRLLADTSSMVLVADIIKLNSSNIDELYRVPVWKLSEPLPPLRLKTVLYVPRDCDLERLDNLSRCTMDVLVVYTDPLRAFTLDFLEDVNAKEVTFYTDFVGDDPFTATEGAANESVRRISVSRASLDVSDVQLLHRFFPRLTEIEIDISLWREQFKEIVPDLLILHEIGQYFASAPVMPVLCGHVVLEIIEDLMEEEGATHPWTAEDVLEQYGKLQEMREGLALVPPQLTVSLWITAAFHRVDESQAKEADKAAAQLGFSRQRTDGNVNEYELKSELAPGRDLWIQWKVSA